MTEPAKKKYVDVPLTQRLPRAPLKKVVVGPPCLACTAPIDVRRNRHGWLHDACEEKSNVNNPDRVKA